MAEPGAPKAPALGGEDWATNPWSLNPWSPVDFDVGAVVQQYFGRSYDPGKLLDLLGKLPTRQPIDPVDMIDLIEMGIFYARNTLEMTQAADNLEHFLVAGLKKDPDRRLPADALARSTTIAEGLCSNHWRDHIRPGILARVRSDPAQDTFPATTSRIPGPSSGPREVVVAPAPSNLPGGGVDLVYKEDTLLSSKARDDLYNAYGQLAFVAEATVESVRHEAVGGDLRWTVSVRRFRVWGWDRYDWFSEDGIGVSIPINLLENLPDSASMAIRAALRAAGQSESVVQELKVPDARLRALAEGGEIKHPNGRTYRPSNYMIYTDAFDFDLAGCGEEPVFEVRP